MKADVIFVVLVTFLITHTGCMSGTVPPGHMLPLGSHQPPEDPGIDILQSAPSPEEFFVDYVEASKPFMIKNHARDMPAFKLWQDDYLKSQFGHIKVDVEQGKKENRSNSLWTMTLKEFLDRYHENDIYLVHSLPQEMMGDIWLIKSLLCGGFINNIMDAVLWFSSGGTKSVFHFDALDNINCLFDGSKELILTPRTHTENLGFAAQGSFSGVDVDRVDMIKYPQFVGIPWYNVSMEPGDCIYIPYRWAHQVRSNSGRNMAINIWFIHEHRFDYEDCMVKGDLPEFAPVSDYGLRGSQEAQMRGELIDFIQSREGSITEEDMLAAEQYFGAGRKDLLKIFQFMDSNMDGKIVQREVEKADPSTFKELLAALEDSEDEDWNKNDPESNINEIVAKDKRSHLETNKSEL